VDSAKSVISVNFNALSFILFYGIETYKMYVSTDFVKILKNDKQMSRPKA